jgi:hypothetical protein
MSRVYKKQTRCKRGHPLEGSNLYLSPKGIRTCRTCRNVHKNRFAKKWSRDNPGKKYESSRPSQLRRLGWTPESWEAANAAQGGLCAICKKTCPTEKRLAADHDHATSRPRQLLCINCNKGLGFFKDNDLLLDAAAIYVRKWRA